MRSNLNDPVPSEKTVDPRVLARRIERQVNLARAAAFLERLLPALSPLLAVVAIFVGLSWLGLWRELPKVVHIPVLIGFAGALGWSLWHLRGLRWPSRESGRRRVEIASGLSNRPLEALDDTLVSGATRLATRALWDAHRRRAARRLGALRFAWPSPNINLMDGYGVRLLAIMASSMIAAAIAVVLLILAAMVLSIAFAVRAAIAGNKQIIDVLHFVGATDRFIAQEFQRHFLLTGLKGGSAGSIAAIAIFVVIGVIDRTGETPYGAQIDALVGNVSVGPGGYFGAVATVFIVAILTAVTSRIAVRQALRVRPL